MKNYETPEAVEIGEASSAILGPKDDQLGDEILGATYPMPRTSVLDVD
jgi:hypothetical protein